MKRTATTRRRFLQAGATAVAGNALLSGAEASQAPPRVKQTDDGVISHPHLFQSDMMKGFPPPKDRRVTIDNWTEVPEALRWTHLNSSTVFKSAFVEKGDVPTWVLPRRMLDPEEVDRATVLWGSTAKDAEKISVADWLRRSDTDALVVLRDGCIVLEQYFGAMTPHTRHALWSASKSVLASILATYLSDGTLDEHALATEYVRALSSSGFAGATLRQLLDMQTGLDAPCFPSPDELKKRHVSKPEEWTFSTPEFRRADNVFARTCRAQAVVRPLGHEPIEGYYDFLLTLTKNRDHGQYFYYTDPNPMVLQWILERTTDISYVGHLKRLLEELGCEDDLTITLDNIGTAVSTIGLGLTARDWARWGQMLCNGGRVGSGRVIPGIRELVDDIRQTPQPEMWTGESNASSWFTKNTGYRSLTWTAPAEAGRLPVIFAHGAFHQKCYVDPERRLVLVKFSSLAEELNAETDQVYGTDDVATQSFLNVISELT